MAAFIVVLLLKIILEMFRTVHRKMHEPKPNPLCTDCFHAHVQCGTKARRAISCTYAGSMREVKLNVLYCTGYLARHAASRREIGFVREIAAAE